MSAESGDGSGWIGRGLSVHGGSERNGKGREKQRKVDIGKRVGRKRKKARKDTEERIGKKVESELY